MTPEPTVYIVDDELIIRTILEDIFTAAKLPVESYASAEEFLLAYSPDNPGCLLLDMIMPGGIDGAETYQQDRDSLRLLPPCPTPKNLAFKT